jgi:hypothetical protein
MEQISRFIDDDLYLKHHFNEFFTGRTEYTFVDIDTFDRIYLIDDVYRLIRQQVFDEILIQTRMHWGIIRRYEI